MDVTLSKSELSRALASVQNVVEKRTTMPILSNVLISASNGLKISATDLEITVSAMADATVRSPGSTTVNARVLSEVVRELPDGDVVLTVTEGERLEVVCQKTKLKLIGVSADEYPSLPGMGIEVTGKISSSQLLELIGKTLYAVSQDETRYNLNGVCFTTVTEEGQKGKSLRLVATDGHRLAMVTRPSSISGLEQEAIVPKKGLGELRKILSDIGEKEIQIGFQEGFFIVDTGAVKTSMRLIDGEFPDYRQVIPKDDGTIATLSSAALGQAIKRVALMVTDKAKCVRFDYSPGTLRVSSSSQELGEATDDLPVDYSGEPVSIGFDARYVQDIANSLGEDRPLVMELHGALGPARIFAEEDKSYIAIVMPMRLP